jgi:hypothetical protein
MQLSIPIAGNKLRTEELADPDDTSKPHTRDDVAAMRNAILDWISQSLPCLEQ